MVDTSLYSKFGQGGSTVDYLQNIRKGEQQIQGNDIINDSNRLKTQIQKLGVLKDLSANVKDDAGLQKAKSFARSMGVGEDVIGQLPDSYMEAKPLLDSFYANSDAAAAELKMKLDQMKAGADIRKTNAMTNLYNKKSANVGVEGSSGSMGDSKGATIAAAQMMMKENPELTFMQAYGMAKKGFDSGITYDPESGQMVALGGNFDAIQEREFIKKTGSELGKAVAEAKVNLPNTIRSAEYSIGVIDQALNDSGFDRNFGVWSLTPNLPSGDAARAATFLDQIGGAAFLTAFETLKGGGQITEVEGEKATNAIARLGRAQDATAARAALQELKGVVLRGMEVATEQASMNYKGETNGGSQDGNWSIEEVSE
jgi:hypothetical protein